MKTRLFPPLILVLLAGCGAQPSPKMFGAGRYATNVDGRDYVVLQKDRLVEVVRLGWASPGEHQAIRANMLAIVPQLTGCKPVPSTVQGDSGQMRMRVTCPRTRT